MVAFRNTSSFVLHLHAFPPLPTSLYFLTQLGLLPEGLHKSHEVERLASDLSHCMTLGTCILCLFLWFSYFLFPSIMLSVATSFSVSILLSLCHVMSCHVLTLIFSFFIHMYEGRKISLPRSHTFISTSCFWRRCHSCSYCTHPSYTGPSVPAISWLSRLQPAPQGARSTLTLATSTRD